MFWREHALMLLSSILWNIHPQMRVPCKQLSGSASKICEKTISAASKHYKQYATEMELLYNRCSPYIREYSRNLLGTPFFTMLLEHLPVLCVAIVVLYLMAISLGTNPKNRGSRKPVIWLLFMLLFLKYLLVCALAFHSPDRLGSPLVDSMQKLTIETTMGIDVILGILACFAAMLSRHARSSLSIFIVLLTQIFSLLMYFFYISTPWTIAWNIFYSILAPSLLCSGARPYTPKKESNNSYKDIESLYTSINRKLSAH